MKIADIPQLTQDGNYAVHQPWNSLEEWIEKQTRNLGLNLNPDFQRAHVWTLVQQRRFVEFCLRGGKGSNILRFNCVGWMNDFRGPFVLVDGKQRLEAVRKFLRNELRVFGFLLKEFEDGLSFIRHNFIIQINDLPTREAVLQWYIDINSGGVAHTDAEIDKVKQLLRHERGEITTIPRYDTSNCEDWG